MGELWLATRLIVLGWGSSLSRLQAAEEQAGGQLEEPLANAGVVEHESLVPLARHQRLHLQFH